MRHSVRSRTLETTRGAVDSRRCGGHRKAEGRRIRSEGGMVFYLNNILSLGGSSRISDFIYNDFMIRARHFPG